MKLSDNQRVAIYASALEGHISREIYYPNQGTEQDLYDAEKIAKTAVMLGDALIAALEARTASNPLAEITD